MPKTSAKTAKTFAHESAAIYGASIGLRSANRDNIIKRLKEGLPISAFDKLQGAMDLSGADLARVVNIAPRTLARRKITGKLQSDESERLLRIGVLFDRAKEVLGGRDAARTWLKSPKRALAGRTPLEYADTEPGAREVEDLIGRIEHGVFG